MNKYENMTEQVEYFREKLMEQVAKNKQLEKEADWLAENAGDCPYISGGNTFCWRHCPMWIGPRDRSGHCEKPDLREAARRAVQNETL